MIRLLYVLAGIIGFIEWYSVGVYFMAKRCGYKTPSLCFVPFMAFKIQNELTGTFTVLTIPVKKYHGMMISFFAVILFACFYLFWGQEHLLDENAKLSLKSIMLIIIVVCALLIEISLLFGVKKAYRKMNVEKEGLYTLLSVIPLSVPLLMYIASKNTPKTEEEMY